MNPIRHVRAFNREVPVFPKEAVDQRIEAILNNFPFDKVRAAMTALKCTWRGEGEPPTETAMQSNARRLLQRAAVMREGEPPTETAMQSNARRLLQRAAVMREGEAIGSGGFRARPGANGDLTLEFVLAHQDEAFSEEDDEGNPAAPGFVCVSLRGPRKEKSDVR